jgi:uncharacterized protein (DUF302 family)
MPAPDDQAEFVTKPSAWPVADTVRRLEEVLRAKGVTVFATIDQRAAALGVGLDLRDTVLVLFGNPAAGTPVMDAVPLSALDLPLKVVVWDDGGQTKVSYLGPEALRVRYGLTPELARPLAAIDVLTDAALSLG